jgi:hypothetical protein
MKKAILILLIVNLSIVLSGQEIEVKGIYAFSSLTGFRNSFGCGVGYYGFVKPKSRMGFFLEYLYNCFPYKETNTSLADLSKNIDNVRPSNSKIAFKFNCSFRILNKSKSGLFIGPELGLILFIIDEKIDRTTTSFGNTGSERYFSASYVKPAAGLGFLLEYELKEIIAHKISIAVSVHPELSGFGNAGKGSSDPAVVGWLNAGIAFRYNFPGKTK